jgi:hypothetical protein
MSEPGISNFSGKISEACDCLLLLVHNVEPAQPFLFTGICPERRIARPQSLGLLIVLPIVERGFNCLCQFIRQRNFDLIYVAGDDGLPELWRSR